MAQVMFKYGSHTQFQGLATKDANTLYFIEDTKELFKGENLYSAAYEVITGNSTENLPAFGAQGKLYIFTEDKAIMRFNGTNFVSIIPGIATAIAEGGTGLVTAGLLKTYVASEINKISIPDISNLAEKATTLAGYGITDAYTKQEVDNKVTSVYKAKGSVDNYAALTQKTDNAVGDVWNVKDTGVNYAWLVDDEHPDGFWDDLGGIVDLSSYLTIEAAANTYATKANLEAHVSDDNIHVTATKKAEWDAKATSQDVATCLTNAKDYADSLASNYATAAQGAKADSALQSADIATGTANGTIKVKDSNVAVYGLGSAAYTASTAYDAAGSAAAVLGSASDNASANTVYGAKAYTDTALTWNTIA